MERDPIRNELEPPPAAETPAKTGTASGVAIKVPRWLALDLFRFLAVLLMVQGHVFYEVLSDTVRAQPWYGWHKYVHGFTAPIFLFSSGLAFGITTLGRWEEHARWGKPVARRFERYVILLALGYVIHLPVLSLGWLLAQDAERFAGATRVDALQHIGMVLMICEGLVLLLRHKVPYLAVIGAGLLIGVASAPWVWNLDVDGLPVPIAAYVNDHTSSIFPIVPWCGFILLGVIVARFVERRRGQCTADLHELAVPLAAVGLVTLFAGNLLHGLWEPFPEHNFWKTSPYFFMIRAGWILIVLAILCAIDLWLQRARKTSGSVLRFVQVVGQQTLVLYVAHLFVIYGVGMVPGVKSVFPRSLGLLGSVAVVMGFFVAMGALAWAWNWAKRHHLRTFDRARYAVTLLLIVIFLLR